MHTLSARGFSGLYSQTLSCYALSHFLPDVIEMVSSFDKLPILVLPHPHVLLPGSRIRLPIPQDVAQAITSLMQGAEEEAPIIVGCVPLVTADSTKCGEYGCSERLEPIF